MFHFCSTQIRSTSQFYHQKLLNNYHKKYKWKCFFEMIVFKLQNVCIIILCAIYYTEIRSDVTNKGGFSIQRKFNRTNFEYIAWLSDNCKHDTGTETKH